VAGVSSQLLLRRLIFGLSDTASAFDRSIAPTVS
jgi:hypothetical protein